MTTYRLTSRSTFVHVVNRRRADSTTIDSSLSPVTVDSLDLSGARAFLADDLLSGYVITRDGDLQAVWSVPRGRGAELVRDAIVNGATSLDHFDVGPLAALYEAAGFRLVWTEENWTPGGPAVHYRTTEPHGARPEDWWHYVPTAP